MSRFDKFFLGVFLGLFFPIFLASSCFACWFYFFQNLNVLYFVFSGLIAGIIIDFFILNKLINKAFNLSIWILIGLYLFYNILIYGFFMAFPVFNLAMGIIAGYYYGIKIKYQEIHFDQSEILIKKVPFFTALVMLIICITTSLIALSEKTIGLELQGMLKLNFEVTRGMIMTLILIGGSSLIIIQYFLTRITIIVTKKRSKS